MVATKPVDFRKGMDGLAALVKEQLRADPFSGVVYVFRAKRADRVKLVWWDGTGLCLLVKRLEDGQFRWPKIEDGVMRLTSAQQQFRTASPRSCTVQDLDSVRRRPRAGYRA
ncbi:IS66 family insertion sequence element accessory protein TnpB [Phenylobacterium sp. LjRoot225]|uniref:IS66 family insertion sequence element accessory protein TnpB n=1 Tax=Phenylobacterium sp. LjRoot225 TaxID=3342285 RepID=UPI003ECDFCAF